MQTPLATGRSWWHPQPDPLLPPISARRAYAEVLFVFAAFFAAGIVGAGLLLADRYRNPLSAASWAVYATQTVDVVMQIGLAVGLVLLLCERRGVKRASLGLAWPRLADGRWAVAGTVRVVAWALFALIVGGVINAALQTGHLPIGRSTAPELVFGMFDSVQAGIIEELVVLAFVVVTLRQARRPWWEVTAVALILRGSYHIYYGPGVAGIVVWAAIYYWLYLRTRQLIPLMVCHACWDAVGFLSNRWSAAAVAAMLVVVAIWIAAPILWLIERNDRAPRPAAAGPPQFQPGLPPSGLQPRGPAAPVSAVPGLQPPGPAPWALPPPGWHPDPGGANRWRWWDGYRWTEHVSHHVKSG